MALAVVRGRAVVHFTGVGEQPRPDAKTQYRLGSITKTITATMVMQLRDEGFSPWTTCSTAICRAPRPAA